MLLGQGVVVVVVVGGYCLCWEQLRKWIYQSWVTIRQVDKTVHQFSRCGAASPLGEGVTIL